MKDTIVQIAAVIVYVGTVIVLWLAPILVTLALLYAAFHFIVKYW